MKQVKVDIRKKSVNSIQDGLFWDCSRMRGAGGGGGGVKKALPSVKSVKHILQWWNLAVIPCLKKSQKIYESRDTSLVLCWHQQFFTGNQQILLDQKIQIKIAFWHIISNSLNFFWVFKYFFYKHGHNFDDVSKIVFSSSS